MHAIAISADHRSVISTLPSSWEEMSLQQFRKVSRVLYESENFKATPTLRVRLVYVLLMSNRNPITAIKNYFLWQHLSPEQVYELSECISYIWKTQCPIAFFPSFRMGWTRYYLPDNHLNNAVVIEYITADASLSNFYGSGDIDDLDRLVATLCRPGKFLYSIKKLFPQSNTGDIREKFNQGLLERRASKFQKLPISIKLYVLYYFVGCKSNILETYKVLFPKSDTQETGEEGSSWVELLKDVASTKLYGNYDDTAFYNLHTVLTNLAIDAEKNRKQRAKK